MSTSNFFHWLLNLPDVGDGFPSAILGCNLASVRLRAGAFISSHHPELRISFGESVREVPKVLIVGKIGSNDIYARAKSWLQIADRVKACGGQIICDYTDHHLGFESPMSEFYRELLPRIDHFVAPSQAMATLIAGFWRGGVRVIPDAVEVGITPPRAKEKSKERTVLWFGHSSNLRYLVDWIRDLDCDGMSLNLRLKILVDEQGLYWLKNNRPFSRCAMRIHARSWDVCAMTEEAQDCDICVIPSDPADLRKKGASSNRLLTGLALGLPVAADALDSYSEFSNYHVNLRSRDFKDLLRDPTSGHGAVLAAQNDLLSQFSMSEIGQCWSAYFQELARIR